ncbi:MAG: IS256 family transposase [Actinobacteria bacterium]|nr:IS256 family transposase [Actinomycetota bacterium]
MASAEVVAKALIEEHPDFLRESVAVVARELMEAEISRQIGAGRGEVNEARSTHRNGYRARPWATRVGEIELAIPRKRSGESYFPSFLEPRKRSEKALLGVVMEAYVNGVSTRKVDHLVAELGIQMSKDQVSRICRELDEQVEAFRTRPLEVDYPYLWLDAKHLKVREAGHIHSKALMVAFAVHESGRREVIGIEIAASETEAGWAAFLRELRARGLGGVKLCVSDDHLGLKAAVAKVLACPWQRCTVHFIRNMHGHCKAGQRNMVAAALREVFNAEDLDDARERAASVIERLAKTVPKVAALLTEAEEDLLAFYRFPPAHWPKLRSTNNLERVNKEIARRSDVVGIFPNDRSVIRLVGALLIEQNDEWLLTRGYLSKESIALVLKDQGDESESEVAALER